MSRVKTKPPPTPKYAVGDTLVTANAVRVNAGLLVYAPPIYVTLLPGTEWTVVEARPAEKVRGKWVQTYRLRAGNYAATLRQERLLRKRQ